MSHLASAPHCALESTSAFQPKAGICQESEIMTKFGFLKVWHFLYLLPSRHNCWGKNTSSTDRSQSFTKSLAWTPFNFERKPGKAMQITTASIPLILKWHRQDVLDYCLCGLHNFTNQPILSLMPLISIVQSTELHLLWARHMDYVTSLLTQET